MRKVILMLALGLTSGSVFAEWTEITTGGNGRFTVYVDLSTIRKNLNLVKMWNLYDLKEADKTPSNGKLYFSVKMQEEYDCNEETIRLIAYSNHSMNMGSGEVIISNYSVHDESQPVAPDSVNAALLNTACGKQ